VTTAPVCPAGPTFPTTVPTDETVQCFLSGKSGTRTAHGATPLRAHRGRPPAPAPLGNAASFRSDPNVWAGDASPVVWHHAASVRGHILRGDTAPYPQAGPRLVHPRQKPRVVLEPLVLILGPRFRGNTRPPAPPHRTPLPATALSTASGCSAATRRRTRAGPSGARRPCSQFRTVAALIPSNAANFACDS
jgi:hypothetical protein